jgi:hypothetical protein
MFHRNYVHRNNMWGASLFAFLAGMAAWAVFGTKAKERLNESKHFKELRNQVMDKTSEISDLTREKYDEVVDEIADKYGVAKGISKHELVDLVDDLKMHWKRIRDAWKNN